MNPYVNEDVAWQRIQDIQREMENSRWLAYRAGPLLAARLLGVGRLARALGQRVVLALRPQAAPAEAECREPEAETDAA